ncbi:MAG: YMGG-like glycine zipper-containing protein [Propionivibrio sp.]
MKSSSIVGCTSALILLAGCASMPTGPSVLVLPGTHRNLGDFRADEIECRQYAAQQISGRAEDPAVRNAAIATAVGAVAGAAIGGHQGAGVGAGAGLLVGSAVGAESSNRYGYDSQRQYDNAYIQCMYAKGHRVPVPASLAQQLREADEPAAAANIPPPPPYPPPKTVPPDYVAPPR